MAETNERDLSFDTTRLREELRELNGLARGFGATLSRAFASAVVDGRKLSDVLRGLALSLSRQALTAALKPVFGAVTPFAEGGVINSPVMFPLRSGLGLAGEAGPEAVLPLARGTDGKLGVRGGAARAVNVTINVTTPDVDGFRRSQSQIAAGVLRAIERGNRNL